MRRLLLLLVATALVAPALAPPAAAQASVYIPGPLQLYLSPATGTLGNATVETLSTQAPVDEEDNVRNVTGGAAWLGLPPTDREVRIDGPVNGTAFFQVAIDPGILPVLLPVHIQGTVTFDLQRIDANGTASSLGSASQEVAVTDTPPVSAPLAVNWSIDATNASLLPGEALALNISAASTSTLGTFQALYDSTARPSGFNLTLVQVVRGNIALAAAAMSRDAAPGSSPVYSVTVRNLGDQTDTVRVNASGVPAEWTVRANPLQLTIPPGSAGTVLLTVVVPSGATDGTRHTATLVAESGNGGAPQQLQLTTTVRAVAPSCPGDADCDGWSDIDERRYNSNPNDRASTPDTVDSDGDGVSNKAEIDAGTDPFDASDFPGALDGGGDGGAGSRGPLAPLSDVIAQSLGVDRATADLLAIVLVALFLLILLGLVGLWLMMYPVKVSLVAARAITEPGRSADYSVLVQNRVGRVQQVDLELSGLPPDWEARFSNPRVNVDPKASETVGVLVRPPDGWPAPSKRDFEVRARSREKPSAFAKAVAKLTIQPRSAPLAPPPAETAVPEPAYEPPPLPSQSAAEAAAALGGAAVGAAMGASFRVAIQNVRHDPAVPERGGEVKTLARIENQGGQRERVRVVLVVNDKVRDEVTTDLAPGEGAEAEFHWVAYLARNDVKVVAERA